MPLWRTLEHDVQNLEDLYYEERTSEFIPLATCCD